MYVHYNANPAMNDTIDCTVRAIAYATDETWDFTYVVLALYGFIFYAMPNVNAVWDRYLMDRGFKRFVGGMYSDYGDYGYAGNMGNGRSMGRGDDKEMMRRRLNDMMAELNSMR